VDPKPESEVLPSEEVISGETIMNPEMSLETERILSVPPSSPTDQKMTSGNECENSDGGCLSLVKRLSGEMECVKKRLLCWACCHFD